MTTYKYSVPWLETETSVASVTSLDEWTKFAAQVGTVLPEVRLMTSSEVPPVTLDHMSVTGEVTPTVRKVYRALKASRRAPRGAVKKQLQGFYKFAVHAKVQASDLQAVHLAYLGLAQWAADHPTSHALRESTAAIKVATATSYAHVHNSKVDPAAARAKMDLIDAAAPDVVAKAFQVWEMVRMLKRVRHVAKAAKLTAKYSKAETDAEVRRGRSAIRAVTRSLLPVSLMPVEFWAGRVAMKVRNQWLVLSTGDLQRLEQYAAGVKNVCVVTAFKAGLTLTNPTDDINWLVGESVHMSEACLVAGRGEEIHVTRAYKEAFMVGAANWAGRKIALNSAMTELAAMPLAEDSGAIRHATELRGMKLDRVANLGKIHKVMPPTSSLGAATAYARYLKAREENPFNPAGATRPVVPDDYVAKCLRDEGARALREYDENTAVTLLDSSAEPAWFRAWVDKKVVPSMVGWAAALNLRGEGKKPARSDKSPSTFKDSALSPDDIPTYAGDVKPKTHTNMAMRRFTDEDYPTIQRAFDNLLATYPRHAKSDQKPENYKDPLRLFYEACLIDRMGVSWSEDCVYSVASHHPCYMLGKKPRDIQARAREMVSPPAPGMSKRFFTYDVSNWSAGMAAKIQRTSGTFWAEVFDDPRVGSAYNTMAECTVFIQKHGMLAGYESPHANFEGYDGKAMTFVHIALMSAVVQRTRQLTGRADVDSVLMAYIDDGASMIEVPREVADEVDLEFRTNAEEVYGAEKFILHAHKCLPSDRMFMFLNEIYYAGVHVVSATKAALKIASEPKDEHDSLPDRMMTLSSGAQGAVQSGLDHSVAALFMYYLAYLELRDWCGRSLRLLDIAPVAVALFFVSPTAYGGLALPSPVGLDKTGKGASIAEGMAAMQSCALAYPVTARRVVALFRTPLPTRTATAILRNPTGSAGLSLLRTNRVSAALADRMEDFVENPVAKSVIAPLWTFDTEGFATALLSSVTTISAASVQLAWKACPCSLAEAWVAKFESSKTIKAVLGRRVFGAIVRAQRKDAVVAMTVAFEL